MHDLRHFCASTLITANLNPDAIQAHLGHATVVLVQPRQAVNQNKGWPDEYAVQVVTTSKTEIQVLVRRLDLNSGWGQSLRLDFFIVD